jgi:hypothetical protein
MTFRKHLRFLYEMFLPREARFDGDKFFDRSGEPASARRKGPPKGTVGTTSKDWGVSDDPAAQGDLDSPGPSRASRRDLYDHFSKTFPEFQRAITDAAKKLYGPNFEQVIDKAFGKPGLTQGAIKDLWDANDTDYEALGDVGFLFDVAQQGSAGTGPGVSGYSHVTDPGNFSTPKEDWDDASGAYVPRSKRPRGVKGGKLVY